MEILIDLDLRSWNKIINSCRYNRFADNGYKVKEMEAISKYLKGIPKITEYPIRLTCYWHMKSVVSDLDNRSLKSVLDCMQHLEIIENDNVKYIQEINYKYVKDKKNYLVIVIDKI